MLKQLTPQFSETFSSDIWQTALSNNKLLIACREEEGMQTHFSLFDLDQHSFIWKSIVFDESWWISIYSFVDQIIIFQVFNDSQNIEARSLFGFDISKLEAIWSIDDANPIGLTGDVLTLKMNSGDDVVFKIDIKSGLEVEETNVEKTSKNEQYGFFLPFHYTEELGHFQSVKHFLKEFDNVDIHGACNYLEHKDLILISAHQKVEQNLTNTFWLFSHSGELILKEILAESCKGLAADTFYIVNEQLIFVKEKREIKGYLI